MEPSYYYLLLCLVTILPNYFRKQIDSFSRIAKLLILSMEPLVLVPHQEKFYNLKLASLEYRNFNAFRISSSISVVL
jgi:hypothetical protein